MGRVVLSIVLSICFIGMTYGTECSFEGLDSQRILVNCPIPILDAPDETYCCSDRCCNLMRWIFTENRLIVGLVAFISVVFMCCCCLCCRCNFGSCRIVQNIRPGYRVIR